MYRPQNIFSDFPVLCNMSYYVKQKFMRRRKFKLHAAFLNATMISAVDAPVEFEVSIGMNTVMLMLKF